MNLLRLVSHVGRTLRFLRQGRPPTGMSKDHLPQLNS